MSNRLEHQLKELDEILEAIQANTSDSTMRLARSGRDIIDEIIEEQGLNNVVMVDEITCEKIDEMAEDYGE